MTKEEHYSENYRGYQGVIKERNKIEQIVKECAGWEISTPEGWFVRSPEQ